jgi:hypothetical protein
MILHYEGMKLPVTLYKDEEVIENIEEINPIKKNDHVYVTINGSYYFYETPWEKNDQCDVIFEMDGRKFETRGTFTNKSKKFNFKYSLKEI